MQDMITAGMDTTAITVEWAIAELVRNPEVQAKAQQELDQVRDSKHRPEASDVSCKLVHG